MKTILRYLKQPSTWRGIIWLLTLFGISLSPEQWQAISFAGIAVVGAIEVFIDEEKAPNTINIQLPPVEMQSKSQFDERGFNEQSRHDKDDGYVSREALKTQFTRFKDTDDDDYPTHSSRVRIPPLHSENFTQEHNERNDESGFNG
jgi:hypothetical protein